jgi:hypothetical protein
MPTDSRKPAGAVRSGAHEHTGPGQECRHGAALSQGERRDWRLLGQYRSDAHSMMRYMTKYDGHMIAKCLKINRYDEYDGLR